MIAKNNIMIKLIDILKEVGEGNSRVYDDKKTVVNSNDTTYTFTTSLKTNYIVYIRQSSFLDEYGWKLYNLDISFKVEGGEYEDVTNKQELYKVMATVVTIIKAHMSQYSNDEIRSITFTPSQEDGEPMDIRRRNLYIAYIKKHAINWEQESEMDDDEVKFINPDSIQY